MICLGTYSREHLGDALCTTPIPRLLAEKYRVPIYAPDHCIARAVFRHNPFVRGFASTGTPLCAIARGDGHIIQRIAQGLELPVQTWPKPEVFLARDERSWARRERKKWSPGRPVCILSTGAVTDSGNLEKVDWARVVEVIKSRYMVVQPLVREGAIPGTVVYRKLPLRRYMALISVCDLFVGGTSGGSHLAAAFDVPALIIIWRSLHKELRFPVSGTSFKSWFLYPQHSFVSSEDLSIGSFDGRPLRESLEMIHETGKSETANALGNHPRNPCGIVPDSPRRIVLTANNRLMRLPGEYGRLHDAAMAG